MALFSNRSWDEWIHEYGLSHQHPINRTCHSIGIPMIMLSIALLPFSLFTLVPWSIPIGLFVLGWIFQFVGHYYEKKPPEFFRDWRFLFVGARWWTRKTFGKR